MKIYFIVLFLPYIAPRTELKSINKYNTIEDIVTFETRIPKTKKVNIILVPIIKPSTIAFLLVCLPNKKLIEKQVNNSNPKKIIFVMFFDSPSKLSIEFTNTIEKKINGYL